MDVEDDFVKVAIRIRPRRNDDISFGNNLKVINNDPPVLFLTDRQQAYFFDKIFNEEADQPSVFAETVEPLADKVLAGYNCTVFAYGQTGTGKSYTMGTASNNTCDNINEGLIVRTFNSLFSKYIEDKEIDIRVTYLEIYNEKVYDLLSTEKEALQIKGFQVVNPKKVKVFNVSDAKQVLLNGEQKRHTAKTKQNSESSRSHAVFTIYCTVRDENNETEAKLHLVDLAGSERAKKTGNQGSQFTEGVNINKGLLSIGQVINALSENNCNIPYRQSTITKILQDSLNRRNYVTLVACVSPNLDDLHETIQTLEFAQRAKRIKNKPEINGIIAQYTKENPTFDMTNIRTIKKVRPAPNSISSSKKGRTPWKRLNAVMYTSTEIKKPRLVNSTLISCPNVDYNTHDRASICLNVSASTIYDIPQNVSPIVRKCIDAVEASIFDKLNILMEEKLPKEIALPRRSPRFSFNSLQTTVTQIVQNELKNYNFLESKRRGQSSAIFNEKENISDLNENKKKVVTRLNFNEELPQFICSPILQNISINILENHSHTKNSKDIIDTENAQSLNVFKHPIGVPKKKRNVKTNLPNASRRSTRLSLKRQAQNPLEDSDIWEIPAPVQHRLPEISKSTRRSSRLSLKHVSVTPRKRGTNQKLKEIPVAAPRKHVENSERSHLLLLHADHVLNILNAGSVKKLKTLATIGEKTAGKIILYQQLKGNFHKISDLKNVLSQGTSYSRFLEANLLTEGEQTN